MTSLQKMRRSAQEGHAEAREPLRRRSDDKMKALDFIRYAMGICASIAILAACNGGRTVAPLLPATGSLLPSNGASAENDNTCPTILVISPAATFSDVGVWHLTLTGTLEKQKFEFLHGCVVVSRTHPPAKWSNTGGSLHVENGGAQAIFSSAKFGIYGVSATYGVYGASAVVLIQRDNTLQLLARLSTQVNGGLLVDTSGALYGVTANSGASVFKLVRGASKVDVIYSFHGYNPYGALIANKRGDLFGTADAGGVGMAYELMRSENDYTERLLHGFSGNGGPTTGLVADRNGALYGTTDGGIVFKLTPSGSSYAYSVLHRFTIKHSGLNDLSGLAIRGDGTLYGTVEGYCACGFVYELTPKGSSYAERTLYRFKGGTDGYNPLGGIVVDSKGVLYGTTLQGGVFGGGTVFDLTPIGSGFTEHILYSFDGLHGAGPTGLTLGPNGGLYGATNGGGGGYGTVFAFDRAAQKERTLHFFEGSRADGGRPYFSPITDATGALYGVTGVSVTESIVYKVTP